MKITIAKDAGYCFGVRDAVNMAYSSAEKHGDVYMLGSIVHNEKVVKDLKNVGAKIVRTLDDVPRESPILFRAHGTIPKLWDEAKAKKMNIIDATCPLVYEIHQEVKKWPESEDALWDATLSVAFDCTERVAVQWLLGESIDDDLAYRNPDPPPPFDDKLPLCPVM